VSLELRVELAGARYFILRQPLSSFRPQGGILHHRAAASVDYDHDHDYEPFPLTT